MIYYDIYFFFILQLLYIFIKNLSFHYLDFKWLCEWKYIKDATVPFRAERAW